MFTIINLYSLTFAQENLIDKISENQLVENSNEDMEITGQHYGGNSYYTDPMKSNYLDRKLELANQHMSNKMLLMDGILNKFHNLKAGLLDSVLGAKHPYDTYHNHYDPYSHNSFLDKRSEEHYNPYVPDVSNYGRYRNYMTTKPYENRFDSRSDLQSIGDYGRKDIEYFRDNSSYNKHQYQDKKLKSSYFDDRFNDKMNRRQRNRNSNYIDDHPVGGFYSLI